MPKNLTAVIPAAGRGSRLGFAGPKLLAPLGKERTIWTVMREKLLTLADRLVIVLSPTGARQFFSVWKDDPERSRISVEIQQSPTGMAPAIAAAKPSWAQSDAILVVWGDQVHVSPKTLERCLLLHEKRSGPRVTFPVVELKAPYVQYVFRDNDQLEAVRETREGHKVDPVGLSDVGTFLLENVDLGSILEEYIRQAPQSQVTGEVNFLPFLPWLTQRGWSVEGFTIDEANEARGINDQEDLHFFQSLYG